MCAIGAGSKNCKRNGTVFGRGDIIHAPLGRLVSPRPRNRPGEKSELSGGERSRWDQRLGHQNQETSNPMSFSFQETGSRDQSGPEIAWSSYFPSPPQREFASNVTAKPLDVAQ